MLNSRFVMLVLAIAIVCLSARSFVAADEAVNKPDENGPKQEADRKAQKNAEKEEAKDDLKPESAKNDDDATVDDVGNEDAKDKDSAKDVEYGQGSLCVYCKYCKV